MSITLVTNHQQAAKNRLREQYKGKPIIEGLLDSWTGQIQDLEQVFIDLSTKRSLVASEGIQLDLLGELLDVLRQGKTDAAYRIALRAKIAKNFSRGTPEDVIAIFKLLTSSTKVQLADGAMGDFHILADHPLTQDEVNILLREMMFTDSAAVRMTGIGSFDPPDSFAFDGSDSAKGFGSIYDVTKGGKFATITRTNEIKFAFSGDDTSGGGFGSIYDPIVGGVFVGL